MLKENTPWDFFEHIFLSFLAASFLYFVRSHHKSVGSCPYHSQITLLNIKQIEPWGAELESRILVHPEIPPACNKPLNILIGPIIKKCFFKKTKVKVSHDNTLKVYEYPSWYAHYAYAVKLLELVLCSYFLPDMNAPYLILTSIIRSIQSYYMIFSPNSTILQINPKNHFLQGPMSWEVAHIFRSPAGHV